MDVPPGPEPPAAHAGRGRFLTRPWFWLLVVGTGFAIPLLKSMDSRLPSPLPGAERPALIVSLPDDTGELRQLEHLRGRVVIVTALSLANAVEREQTFAELRHLQKRLRGLTAALGWLVLCPGGGAADLSALLDAKTARRPYHLYLLDAGGAEMLRLASEAGSPGARFLLLDRHGRARGVYGEGPAEQDRLVGQAGELANWPGQDP